MLSIEGRTVVLGGVKALDGVSLSIGDGERVAVVGPNGAGKTTLLRELAKAPPGEGGVRGAACVAVVPQDIPADLPLKARDYVMLGRTRFLSPWRRPSREDEDAVARALESVDALGLAGRMMDEISGGERQRVALAMCLASGARALLMDEPVSHLDARRKREFYGVLGKIGATVVATLHELPPPVFTRAVLMSEGRIVSDGPPNEALSAENIAGAYGMRGLPL